MVVFCPALPLAPSLSLTAHVCTNTINLLGVCAYICTSFVCVCLCVICMYLPICLFVPHIDMQFSQRMHTGIFLRECRHIHSQTLAPSASAAYAQSSPFAKICEYVCTREGDTQLHHRNCCVRDLAALHARTLGSLTGLKETG